MECHTSVPDPSVCFTSQQCSKIRRILPNMQGFFVQHSQNGGIYFYSGEEFSDHVRMEMEDISQQFGWFTPKTETKTVAPLLLEGKVSNERELKKIEKMDRQINELAEAMNNHAYPRSKYDTVFGLPNHWLKEFREPWNLESSANFEFGNDALRGVMGLAREQVTAKLSFGLDPREKIHTPLKCQWDGEKNRSSLLGNQTVALKLYGDFVGMCMDGIHSNIYLEVSNLSDVITFDYPGHHTTLTVALMNTVEKDVTSKFLLTVRFLCKRIVMRMDDKISVNMVLSIHEVLQINDAAKFPAYLKEIVGHLAMYLGCGRKGGGNGNVQHTLSFDDLYASFGIVTKQTIENRSICFVKNLHESIQSCLGQKLVNTLTDHMNKTPSYYTLFKSYVDECCEVIPMEERKKARTVGMKWGVIQ